jgi:hypothetical protein
MLKVVIAKKNPGDLIGVGARTLEGTAKEGVDYYMADEQISFGDQMEVLF